MKIVINEILLDQPHVVLATITDRDQIHENTLIHLLPNNSPVPNYKRSTASVDALAYAETYPCLGDTAGYGHVVCESGAFVAWVKEIEGTRLYLNGCLSAEAIAVLRALPYDNVFGKISDLMARIPAELQPHKHPQSLQHFLVLGGRTHANLLLSRNLLQSHEVDEHLRNLQTGLHILRRATLVHANPRTTTEGLRKLHAIFPEKTKITFNIGNNLIIRTNGNRSFEMRKSIIALLPPTLIETHHPVSVNPEELRKFEPTPELLAQINDICEAPYDPDAENPATVRQLPPDHMLDAIAPVLMPYETPPWVAAYGQMINAAGGELATAEIVARDAERGLHNANTITLPEIARIRDRLNEMPAAYGNLMTPELVAYAQRDLITGRTGRPPHPGNTVFNDHTAPDTDEDL